MAIMLQVLRFSSSKDDTLGLLFDVTDPENRQFLCFTLEDEFREVKVKGETRIPSGVYPIGLRQVGRHIEPYKKKYGSMFKGMLWIQNVPNFQYILIHTGNKESHTAGCLLVGQGVMQNVTGNGKTIDSTGAFKRIYPPIAAAIEAGEEVHIMFVDLDDPKEAL